MPVNADHDIHVDLINVGKLLPIYLDTDEVLIQNPSDLLTLKGVVLHDVAPVAGRISDREEYRLVLGSGSLKSGISPWVPPHRIILVLPQVRTGLCAE
jgi:hypothetical protein